MNYKTLRSLNVLLPFKHPADPLRLSVQHFIKLFFLSFPLTKEGKCRRTANSIFESCRNVHPGSVRHEVRNVNSWIVELLVAVDLIYFQVPVSVPLLKHPKQDVYGSLLWLI